MFGRWVASSPSRRRGPAAMSSRRLRSSPGNPPRMCWTRRRNERLAIHAFARWADLQIDRRAVVVFLLDVPGGLSRHPDPAFLLGIEEPQGGGIGSDEY